MTYGHHLLLVTISPITVRLLGPRDGIEGVTYYNPKDISSVLVAPHAVFSGIATIVVGLRFYATRIVTWSP